jgi:uncharacterized protein (DUF433 family)
MTQNLSNRITVNPKQCGGRPCVRGMRIRVTDVLDLFVAGLTADEILEELPDLEREDLYAAQEISFSANEVGDSIKPRASARG